MQNQTRNNVKLVVFIAKIFIVMNKDMHNYGRRSQNCARALWMLGT